MKAEITLKQLWLNPSVAGFFFRQQAWKEFEKLVDLVGARESEDQFDALSYAVEGVYMDLDEFKEDLYDRTAEEIVGDLMIEY